MDHDSHDDAGQKAAGKETTAARRPPSTRRPKADEYEQTEETDRTEDEEQQTYDLDSPYIRALVASAPVPDADLVEELARLLGYGCH